MDTNKNKFWGVFDGIFLRNFVGGGYSIFIFKKGLMKKVWKILIKGKPTHQIIAIGIYLVFFHQLPKWFYSSDLPDPDLFLVGTRPDSDFSRVATKSGKNWGFRKWFRKFYKIKKNIRFFQFKFTRFIIFQNF